MAYTAWETAAGEALAEVEAYCRHAARSSAGTFTTNTTPTKAAVERWLTVSYHWIRSLLASAGLSTTQTDATVLAVLQELNALDVAAKVELSLPEESGSGEPNQRFLAFDERRKELIEIIADGTLAAMGATTSASGRRMPTIGGERLSRKAVAEEDTDRTQHRIRRNIFGHPSNGIPSTTDDFIVRDA